jgi:hypothetical protein
MDEEAEAAGESRELDVQRGWGRVGEGAWPQQDTDDTRFCGEEAEWLVA